MRCSCSVGLDWRWRQCLAHADAERGTPLRRRGEWPDWLAVTSDKGTAHVFSLRRGMAQGAGSSGGSSEGGAWPEGTSPSRTNPTSALSFISVSGLTEVLGMGGGREEAD